jgi:DNA polymerase-3 subunit epsilon
MQNGDFPLYTKKVLENIWNRYKKEKSEQKAKAAATHSVEDKKTCEKGIQSAKRRSAAEHFFRYVERIAR